MSEKETLIELLRLGNVDRPERVANILLAGGVIAPAIKVGFYAYCIYDNAVHLCRVFRIEKTEDNLTYAVSYKPDRDSTAVIWVDRLFNDIHDAETALKGEFYAGRKRKGCFCKACRKKSACR